MADAGELAEVEARYQLHKRYFQEFLESGTVCTNNIIDLNLKLFNNFNLPTAYFATILIKKILAPSLNFFRFSLLSH